MWVHCIYMAQKLLSEIRARVYSNNAMHCNLPINNFSGLTHSSCCYLLLWAWFQYFLLSQLICITVIHGRLSQRCQVWLIQESGIKLSALVLGHLRDAASIQPANILDAAQDQCSYLTVWHSHFNEICWSQDTTDPCWEVIMQFLLTVHRQQICISYIPLLMIRDALSFHLLMSISLSMI